VAESALIESHLSHDIFLLIIVYQHGCRLILLSCLCFAAIAFLAEGKIEIVTVVADPIALAGLG
jgi:hypothetical protein